MSFYARLAQLTAAGQPVAVCTVTKAAGSVPRQPGAKMLVLADGRIEGTIGGGAMEARVLQEALQALQDGKPRTLEYTLSDAGRGDPGICGGTLEVFVDPVQPQATLLVIGAGHVGRAVARLGDWLGFRVLVSDDRAELLTHEFLPQSAELYTGSMADLPSKLQINSSTYILLTTRNADVDVAGLPALLESSAGYIGVIGSRKRWALARQRLQAGGVSAASLDRVHSPMGLELNAETPEEIAVSIMAQLIMLRRGGDGRAMSG